MPVRSTASPISIAATRSYNVLESDHIDLTSISQISAPTGNGVPADQLVRLREDASRTFSTLDIFVDNAWLPFVRLDNIHAGEGVQVILNGSNPSGVLLFAAGAPPPRPTFENDLGSRGADWRVAGVGDFDADGTSDIMWQNTTTGGLDDWKMLNGNWAAIDRPRLARCRLEGRWRRRLRPGRNQQHPLAAHRDQAGRR